MDNAVKTILIILAVVAGILLLGLLIGFIYLLFQVGITILPVCIFSIIIMLLVQMVYFKYRINTLKKSQASTNLYTPKLDFQTGHWFWKYEESQSALYLDLSLMRFLSLITGIFLTLFFLSRLYSNGSFDRHIWWFWRNTAGVPAGVSVFTGFLLSGFMMTIASKKINLILFFSKILTKNADFFISIEDRLNLENANNLFMMALQFCAEAKKEIQNSDMASMMELEQISQALVSENLAFILKNRKWQDFKAIMEGIIADILRLKQSGNSGTGNQSNSWGNAESDEEKACRILGVSLNATPDEIKEAHKNLSKFWHPDKETGDVEMMKEINWAYDILKREKQFV